jgi:cyclopropane fatty-acyl-phospholipid synthase-like methyltransferase
VSLPLLPRGPVTDRIERAVIGGDFGADGYTTRVQAEDLARHLDLRPECRLLDLGSGRGWPALYLAARTGCHAVLTDYPLDRLAAARSRAEREDLQDRCAVVAAAGPHLPFASGMFDAAGHADVLC